jgi:hypothetical protein
VGESVHEQQVYGGLLTHAACPVVPVCCRCCMWLPVLVSPPHMQDVGAMNASNTWHMHGKRRPKTTREGCQLAGSCLVGEHMMPKLLERVAN